MQQSSSKANRPSAGQEIHRFLWNPKFHYLLHKGPPLVPILSQLNPVHVLTQYKIRMTLNYLTKHTHQNIKDW
jgi:hypothetical protein